MEVYEGDCDSLDKSFRAYSDKVKAANVTYSLVATNSNAFIYSMLNAAGINANPANGTPSSVRETTLDLKESNCRGKLDSFRATIFGS